ncbi:hypothetical protein D3C80_2196610 [compost metagenome]
MHRGLEFLEAAGTIHRVPLLQHPIIVQVGVTQAVGKLLVPIELARPLYDRAEL